MELDWRAAIKSVAPTLGGLVAATGPLGALAGMGLNAVAAALGVPPDEDAVAVAVQEGLTPEQRAALAIADSEIKKELIKAGIREKELEVDVTRAVLADVQDARAKNASNTSIIRMVWGIQLLSYGLVALVLCGAYWVMSGRGGIALDPGVALTFGGIIGSCVQWVLMNAQQAAGFVFGTTTSARANAENLSKAAAVAVTAVAKK